MKVYELISMLMRVPSGLEVVGNVSGTLDTNLLYTDSDDKNFMLSFGDPSCIDSDGNEICKVTELIEFYEENAE